MAEQTKIETAWDFVTKFLPNYSNSEDVALKALSKVNHRSI